MSHKPNDHLLESLSALVDDEASELEVRRILKTVDDNPEVLECWRRFNLIGSLIRKESDIEFSSQLSFAASIANMVDAEPERYELPQRASGAGVVSTGVAAVPRSGREAWGLLGKTSIAASFAAALVFSFNLLGDRTSQPQLNGAPSAAIASTPVVAPMVAPEVPRGFQLPTLEARTVSQSNAPTNYFDDSRRLTVMPQADDLTDVATQDMLNQMLIFHAERASVNGSLGMMPFARVSKMQDSR